MPWITPAIRRKIRKKNKTHAKAKKKKLLRIKVTQDLHLIYNKMGETWGWF